jgi:hypothetical protein
MITWTMRETFGRSRKTPPEVEMRSTRDWTAGAHPRQVCGPPGKLSLESGYDIPEIMRGITNRLAYGPRASPFWTDPSSHREGLNSCGSLPHRLSTLLGDRGVHQWVPMKFPLLSTPLVGSEGDCHSLPLSHGYLGQYLSCGCLDTPCDRDNRILRCNTIREGCSWIHPQCLLRHTSLSRNAKSQRLSIARTLITAFKRGMSS